MLHENCTLDILKSYTQTQSHTNHANTRKLNQTKRIGTKRTNKPNQTKKRMNRNGMEKKSLRIGWKWFCYTNNTNDSVFSYHHPIDLFAYTFLFIILGFFHWRGSSLSYSECVYALCLTRPIISRLCHTQNSHEIFINKHIVWHFASKCYECVCANVVSFIWAIIYKYIKT